MHPNTLVFLKFLRAELERSGLTPQSLYDRFVLFENLSPRDARDLALSLADELGFTDLQIKGV